jgi:hypothetical protein
VVADDVSETVPQRGQVCQASIAKIYTFIIIIILDMVLHVCLLSGIPHDLQVDQVAVLCGVQAFAGA